MSRISNADFNILPKDGMAATREQVEKAALNLKKLFKVGHLEPLPDWDGDVVSGYMDMLGLNGRAIRVNHGPGMRRR